MDPRTNETSALPAITDPERLRYLAASGLLDSKAEAFFDRQTRLLKGLLDVPVALISLVDSERQFFKSSVGLPDYWQEQCGSPLSHSFCKFVVADRHPLVVSDARNCARLKDNPAISELGVAAYAGYPIILREGHILGSVCVVDTKPREWKSLELDLVESLAELVSREIDLRLERSHAHETQRYLEEAIEHLMASNLEITATNERLEQFAHILAHDLNGPLSTILMTLDLLVLANEDRKVEQYAERCVATTKQVAEILKDLLTFAGGGTAHLERTKVDLDELVQTVIEDRGLSDRHTVKVDCQPLGVVDGYRSLIWMIFKNLFENAVKYALSDSLEIRICRRGDVWSFSDNGPGIKPEYQSAIFDIFDRAGATTLPGSGLGLYICQQAVSLHGGQIWLDSKFGDGCSFHFTLAPESSSDRSEKSAL